MMINILITRNRLAALTQRKKNSQISKVDSKNKSRNNQDSSFEFRSKSMKQRSHRNDMMSSRTNQTDNSINANRNEKITKLFLKEIDEQSSDFKDKRICYNCDEKKYITSKCFKFKQKNLQINVIEHFRQNIQIVVERAPSVRFITEVFDESKN